MDSQKLKKENESLKKELKQLNDQLNKILEKVQAKPHLGQQQKDIEGRMQILKKELQTETKKNILLKKEIQQMRYKEKYLEGYKVDDLKNIIKEKEKNIEELTAKIRLFEKLEKQEKNGDSYRKEEELTQKIMQQNEEIVHLKKKLQEAKKNEEQLEKSVKSLREAVAALEGKTQQKPTTDTTKPKQKNDAMMPKQQFDKLTQKFKQLETAKKMNDKSSRQEIDSLTLKLKNFEREYNELKDQVSKKEKQGNILMFRLKEKQRRNFSTMEPIKTARYSEEVLHSSNLFENRKEFKGLTYGQGIYREFDDSKQLPIEKNYRIKKVVFTHFEEHILSLTTEYETINAQLPKQSQKTAKVVDTFAIPSQYSNIKTIEYCFGDYEYIAVCEIYTLKSIELIRLVTSKEETIEIGNTKNIPKYKRHVFEIRNHEKPISFMGVIENKRVGADNKEFLVSLGLEIRRKEVFIRSKSNKKQEAINRRSFLEKVREIKE